MAAFGVSYFGQHDPLSISTDLYQIRRIFDWVIFPVTEEDVRYRADGFRRRIAEAKRLGLEVWVSPWGVSRLFGGEGLSAVRRDGFGADIVLDAWLRFAETTEADTILFDEVRGTPRQRAGVARRMAATPVRRSCYFSDPAGIEALAANADDLGIDLYWPPRPQPTLATRTWREWVGSRHVWVQGFRVAERDRAAVYASVRAAADLGADRIGVWGYRGSATMSSMQCDGPEAFWDGMLAAIGEAS